MALLLLLVVILHAFCIATEPSNKTGKLLIRITLI